MDGEQSYGFALAQLQVLRRQIDALKRLNSDLRALKHRARMGAGIVAAETHATKEEKKKAARKPHSGRAGPGAARGAKRKSISPGDESASESELYDADTSSDEDASKAAAAEGEGSDGDGDGGTEGELRIHQPAARRTPAPRRAAAAPKSLAEDSDGSWGEGGGRHPATDGAPGGGGGGVQRSSSSLVATVTLVAYQPVAAAVSCREEDAACHVCGDGDATDGNEILLCDGPGCGVAVHLSCYGVRKVPKGRWLCDGCAAGLPPDGAHCCVCPVAGGALRAVKKVGKVSAPAGEGGAGSKQPPPGGYMVHLACALWTPEIAIEDPGGMRAVSLAGLTAARQALRCALCKQLGGAVVQCSFGGCSAAFHVLCGRAAGNVLAFREDGEPVQYCPLHSGERFAAQRDALSEREELAAREGELEGGEATPA